MTHIVQVIKQGRVRYIDKVKSENMSGSLLTPFIFLYKFWLIDVSSVTRDDATNVTNEREVDFAWLNPS